MLINQFYKKPYEDVHEINKIIDLDVNLLNYEFLFKQDV